MSKPKMFTCVGCSTNGYPCIFMDTSNSELRPHQTMCPKTDGSDANWVEVEYEGTISIVTRKEIF